MYDSTKDRKTVIWIIRIARLQLNGITFKQRELNSLKELTNDYDIVINCTGLGARKLCYDRRLVSLRGQVLKVWHYLALRYSSFFIHTIFLLTL